MSNYLKLWRNSQPKAVMTIAEVATYLGTTFVTVKKLMKQGELPYRNVGRRYFFSKEAVDRWLQGKTPET